jgi:hypothetical protein
MFTNNIESMKATICVLFVSLIFLCCQKEETGISNLPAATGPNPTDSTAPDTPGLWRTNQNSFAGLISCDSGRTMINASLKMVGFLSEGRTGLEGGTVGSKIFFAGGIIPGAYSSRVDIYDTITHLWTKAELTIKERQGMAVATIGNKIFFAGGQDADWIDVTSRVDIYDIETDTWSTAELSEPRAYLAATVLGDKVYFAGGANWSPLTAGSPRNYFVGSKVIDIYDNSTGTWSTAQLSEGRYELSATSVGNKIYFAGGLNNIFSISETIDIYDAVSDKWSTSQLQEPKAGHVGVASENKIFWVAGANSPYQSGYSLSSRAEIKDLASGISSFECVVPKSQFKVVATKEYIIFFTGNVGTGNQFEIYNIATRKWSTGVLDKTINASPVVSVNNTIYVAGGRGSNPWGPYYKEVWKLDF